MNYKKLNQAIKGQVNLIYNLTNNMDKQNQADIDYEANKIHAHYELLKQGVKSGAKCYDCGEPLLYAESETDICGECVGEMGSEEDHEL